jgi:hypothetical protein
MSAVEFENTDHALILIYRPRDGTSWINDKWDRNEELIIKKTFHLRQDQLEPTEGISENDKYHYRDGDELRFIIARKEGEYYHLDSDIIPVGFLILIHQDASPNWNWFTAEQRTSVFALIAQLRPQRIVIGGAESDAIPIGAYEGMIANFPSSHELKRYVLARISVVVREYANAEVDAGQKFRDYVNKRLRQNARNIISQFRPIELKKYEYLLARLNEMLSDKEGYNEATWQTQILQIILLLYPRYIKAIEKVRIRDSDRNINRELDILLVDASGSVDVIEIKQPSKDSIVTSGLYRDNHIPLRELSGSVMQVEKYIYHLNRWGAAGEEALTSRYADQLPRDFRIKITNPSAIIILGRDNDLTEAQRRDFEIVRRKYRLIADIITYDDLVRRLTFVIEQLQAEGAEARVHSEG